MKSDKKTLKAFRWAVGYLGKDQAEIGRILNLKQPAVSLLLGDKREVKLHHVRLLAEEIGITLEEVMARSAEWSEDDETPIRQPANNNVVNIDHQHAEIIKKFQNRDLALVINQELLDLESMDPDKLKSVLDFIKFQKKEAAETVQKKREAGNDKT